MHELFTNRFIGSFKVKVMGHRESNKEEKKEEFDKMVIISYKLLVYYFRYTDLCV